MSRLYWSNLPDAKRPRGGTSALCSSLHHRGLADAGIAGDEHEFRCAVGHDAVEGCEQGVDLALPPVELLRDQQPVRGVVRAQRERSMRPCASQSARHRRRSAARPAAVW